MTNREKEILELIRKDPMISQQDVADQLGIARPSVAVHITNLMKKGFIRGKGYVLAENNRTVVIGGANMDIYGFPNKVLEPGVSNPGQISASSGGVGRNIAENLARLGVETSLVTAVGSDNHGEGILEECRQFGLDISKAYVSSKYPTSTYLAIQNELGEMCWAISQMDSIDALTVQYMREIDVWLEQAAVIVLDANLPKETIEWLCQRYKGKPIWMDPVSIEKSKKITEVLPYLSAIKPNRQEAEQLSGIVADSLDGIAKNWAFFMDQGIRELWLSLGSEGLFYGDLKQKFFVRSKHVESLNTNGAGDALMAAAVKYFNSDLKVEDRIRYAMGAAMATCTAKETIHPNMSEGLIQKYINEVYIDECIS